MAEGNDDPFDRFLDIWSRRQFLRASGGALAFSAFLGGGAAFLAACGGNNTPTSTSAKPVRGGKLVEAGPRDLLDFNTVRRTLISVEAIVHPLLFPGLLINTPTGDLIPNLADSLPKISSDGLTYTFTLRKNVKWSDGSPLTADDVLFTYKAMYDPATKDILSAARADLSTYLDSITAPDPYTVVFKTKTAYAPFVATHARYGILPKKVLGNLSPTEFNNAPFWSNPTVSAGPFKFAEWAKGDHVTLARNDSYFGAPAYLDQYILRTITDTTATVNALKNGEIDAARIFQIGVVADLQAQPNLGVQGVDAPGLLRYLYQLDPAKKASAIFSDPQVRQALYLALDRQGMANSSYFKIGAKVQDQAWPPFSWAYNPSPTIKYPFDKAKAASMLDAAGWAKGADGIRSKNGVRMSFNIVVPSTAPDYQNSAQIMQQNWKDIGIEAKPQVVAYAAWNAAYYTSRDFDTLMYGGGPGIDPDESVLYASRNAAPGGQDAMDYKNPDLDALLDQAVTTTDKTKRKQLYVKAQDILLKDVPAPILYMLTYFWVYNKRVHNYGGDNTTIGPWAYNDPRQTQLAWVTPT